MRRAACADDQVRAFPGEVDLALAVAFLEIQIAEHEGRHFYRGNPSLWIGRGDLLGRSR